MSGMIERVARAICKVAQPPPGQPCHDCDNGECSSWENYVEDARVAVEAMREPDKAMVDRAWAMIGSNLRYEEAYRHLIDAALFATPARRPEQGE